MWSEKIGNLWHTLMAFFSFFLRMIHKKRNYCRSWFMMLNQMDFDKKIHNTSSDLNLCFNSIAYGGTSYYSVSHGLRTRDKSFFQNILNIFCWLGNAILGYLWRYFSIFLIIVSPKSMILHLSDIFFTKTKLLSYFTLISIWVWSVILGRKEIEV